MSERSTSELRPAPKCSEVATVCVSIMFMVIIMFEVWLAGGLIHYVCKIRYIHLYKQKYEKV